MYTTIVFHPPAGVNASCTMFQKHEKSCRWMIEGFSNRKQENSVISKIEPRNRRTLRPPSANFHPSLWGDQFISFSPNYATMDAWHIEARTFKEKIKKKLNIIFETKAGLGEKLNMIDVIQRLGIAYHFEEEIEQALNQIFNQHELHEPKDDNVLLISALRFRLLREHGYNASSEVFNKFKDGENRFNKAGDVQTLLALYEATHLRVHGEAILEEALEFTRAKLQEMAPHLQPSLAKQVQHALSQPIRTAVPRVLAREFMSFYQESEFHDDVLLKFAMLDFNILQKQHQEELSILSKWWRTTLDVGVNFPFARDRLVECYFWVLGAYYEPQYKLARKFFTKVNALITILDDIYDVHATPAELELLFQGILRWEIHAMEELPDYMKIYYKALLEVYREMEDELSDTKRSFTVNYAIEAKKNLVRAYHEESKWLQQGKRIPTLEEYMETALVSISYELGIVASFVGMGEIATKDVFEWLMGRPTVVRAASLICRLMNDIASHKHEQEREHIPSAVECYMHQHGVSEKTACEELKKQVENAWKDINEAFLDAESPPMPLMVRILNLSRVPVLIYKEHEGFIEPIQIKHYLDSLLVDQLEI